ncbi:hypothetical protein TNCV_2577111 [Trichonephila clavipes]|nr:hypothetical protein TNCV_2577111 [Trichonephila clavipes]
MRLQYDLAQLHPNFTRENTGGAEASDLYSSSTNFSGNLARIFVDISNAHTCIRDHLTSSLPVPTDHVVSQVFIEFSALEQVFDVDYGMAAEWAELFSSQTKPVSYIAKRSFPVVMQKRTQQPRLARGASG